MKNKKFKRKAKKMLGECLKFSESGIHCKRCKFSIGECAITLSDNLQIREIEKGVKELNLNKH